jgi:hypothetical protein
MRLVVICFVLVGCTPPPISPRARARLGVHGKQLHLMDYDRLEGLDIYTFCRSERRRDIGNLIPIGERSYDGACVTYVCPAGDDGRRCRE